MPPTVQDRLHDVLESIANIEELLASFDLDAFRANTTFRAATERYPEIICEAARNIPDHIKQEAPNIEWRKMTDFGNQLRHAYHLTKDDMVWDVIRDHLPPLKSFVEQRIREGGQ
ncbi:MAG: HepT-like ribonuclease domain-containing protein [Tardiphaga sp.]